MPLFKRKKMIKQAVAGAKLFVEEQFRPDAQEKENPYAIRHSRKITSAPENKTENNNGKDGQRKYQSNTENRDNYNSDPIDRVLSAGNSGSTADDILRTLSENTNMSFVDKILEYEEINHLRDTDIYKTAHIDRRLFSKIVSDSSYKPAKDTCIAITLAMKLSPTEAADLLSRAGYVLSHSNKRDLVIEYCIRSGIYELGDVNEILYKLQMRLILN